MQIVIINYCSNSQKRPDWLLVQICLEAVVLWVCFSTSECVHGDLPTDPPKVGHNRIWLQKPRDPLADSKPVWEPIL